MATIIRLTTPTIRYDFKVVNVLTITEAYLTIKQNGSVLIEKDLNAATVGEKSISWKFSQAETEQMLPGKITLMLNWLTDDGIRGGSEKSTVVIDQNYKDEVI